MNLKKNILANYASQIYVTLAGVALLPLYVRYMGSEAYGLVGFFSVLQAWFGLLDMGLGPTMAREAARYNGGAGDALSLRRLLRALEGLFLAVGLAGGGALIVASGWIAGRWLKVEHLPLSEVRDAVVLIAVVIVLRWISGLYRGVVTGFERLVWLSGFNAVVATARFVLVVPYLMFVGATPTDFFRYQLGVAVFEVIVLALQSYRSMPAIQPGTRTPWRWAPLRGVLAFSLSIAFTGTLWVVVTQTDKLLLSSMLPLSEYAHYTLAVLAASGVTILSGPVGGALMPRMARLAAAGDEAGLISLYHKATQLVASVAFPVSLALAVFAWAVLWAWTGDAGLARAAAPVLACYALGNGLLALGAFPYYMQYAKGDLKLHVYSSVLFAVVFLPALFAGVWRLGATGAGVAWLGTHALLFLFWLPRIHARFYKGLHVKWLVGDALPAAVASAAVLACVRLVAPTPGGRISAALIAIGAGALALILSVVASPQLRTDIARIRLRRRS
jgi:O-antigen/teichoic acid export membrane protein